MEEELAVPRRLGASGHYSSYFSRGLQDHGMFESLLGNGATHYWNNAGAAYDDSDDDDDDDYDEELDEDDDDDEEAVPAPTSVLANAADLD